MNYRSAVEYIESIPLFHAKKDPQNTKRLLYRLGDPQYDYPAFHVAGTNGKGSVSKLLELMLMEAGYRTGLFISPHLKKINERLSINGCDITDEELALLAENVKNISDKASEDGIAMHPAYFEFLFLCAAKYFSDHDCGFAVFETGLGGRLDATNVLTPKICAITSIGLDHMQYLGNDIRSIAAEKAGIIKPGVPVIYHLNDNEADDVIREAAGKAGAPSIGIASDMTNGITDILDDKALLSDDAVNILHSLKGDDIFGSYMPPYQYENLHVASAVFLAYANAAGDPVIGAKECSRIILAAARRFYWPGRMQQLKENVILDGAHNEHAVRRLVQAVIRLKQDKGFNGTHLMFSVCADKDYESMIRLLSLKLHPEKVFVTQISSDRKLETSYAKKLFEKYLEKNIPVLEIKDPLDAYRQATDNLDPDTVLVISGSLYLAGELLK